MIGIKKLTGEITVAKKINPVMRSLNKAKEPDSDSGNCDDVCSIHNSTPQLSHNACKSSPNILKSFQSKFLSTTRVEQGIDHKVPSSISSGNNSMNTNSSQNGSPATSQRSLNKSKEPDSDSGNCDDVCSVHNSTPQLSHNACKSSPNILKSFQSKFLSTTGVEQGIDHKVPSSISSGNNSMNTNSSQNGSPATSQFIPTSSFQNTSRNHKQKESSIASGPKHCMLPHHSPPPQESGSDNYPAQNTSEMSNQTINGENFCAYIDDLFFSDIL
ncbi:developmentally-regulated protein kinase 1-like [Watersipora subatra]|uniref:developmentally-regulated protein kinase 1-like n=1 Tax=Watersipora subatra TaxID=2589382 RepID=UPI00355BF42F